MSVLRGKRIYSTHDHQLVIRFSDVIELIRKDIGSEESSLPAGIPVTAKIADGELVFEWKIYSKNPD